MERKITVTHEVTTSENGKYCRDGSDGELCIYCEHMSFCEIFGEDLKQVEEDGRIIPIRLKRCKEAE